MRKISMKWTDWILLGCGLGAFVYPPLFFVGLAMLLILPPSWDPAIRWKEYNIKWKQKLDK